MGGGGRYDARESYYMGVPVIKSGADPREWDDKIALERTMWEERTFKSNSASSAGRSAGSSERGRRMCGAGSAPRSFITLRTLPSTLFRYEP